ncbi:hypothetical protein K678_06240 [Magnetospirillum fulvum MGU-K5]|uniref:Uncharacterized protein n=1 Tax=Magnetospirillum fulvum MGU-K5 TaxID=1316936 RepID=S9TV46_MAGFU|nr:hypothetical protein K678_06240 [Magnetospirillum fulvum MGU-K5]
MQTDVKGSDGNELLPTLGQKKCGILRLPPEEIDRSASMMGRLTPAYTMTELVQDASGPHLRIAGTAVISLFSSAVKLTAHHLPA